MDLVCHIIGFNSKNKKQFYNSVNSEIYNIIDLDELNNQIYNDKQLDKMYKEYTKYKQNKNDKYKDIDKQMTDYWNLEMINKINSLLSSSKKNIFIGLNIHYKNQSKKLTINTKNNFIIKSNLHEDTKILIEQNLDSYRELIINGKYPLEYINYDFIYKKKENIYNIYIKTGYIEKTIDDIIQSLELLNNKTDVLWICSKDSYNINSKIYPIKNSVLFAFTEPSIALIDSFNFNDSEIKFDLVNNELSVNEIKPNTLTKMKKLRYLYVVDNNGFMPYDKNKYIIQSDVVIKGKEKIDNVYKYLSL